MSISTSYSWHMSAQMLVNAALRKLGVISGGETPATYQIQNGYEVLNSMLLSFQADGMPVWIMTSATFTTTTTNTYLVGTGQTINTPMPLKIVQAWRSTSGQANIPLNIYTDNNFNLLPQIASPGTPVNLYYQPGEYTVGTIKLWPTPQDSSNTITIRYQKPFADITTDLDEIDFPRYWYEAVIYGLADRLAPEYGIPIQDRQLLKQEAEMKHTTALSFGTEEGSLYFQPDWVGQ